MITDYDGNSYGTVIIGNQEWMAENLKTTHYRNGTPIEYAPSHDEWNHANQMASGAYVWVELYHYDDSYKDYYGALYNWYAVNDPNYLCPAGWQVPTYDDYNTLIDYAGGEIGAGKLKSTRTDPDPHPRWNSPNTGATNETKWSGFPAGERYNGFWSFGQKGFWWSSTAHHGSVAWYFSLYVHGGYVLYHNVQGAGHSVRCLREMVPPEDD